MEDSEFRRSIGLIGLVSLEEIWPGNGREGRRCCGSGRDSPDGNGLDSPDCEGLCRDDTASGPAADSNGDLRAGDGLADWGDVMGTPLTGDKPGVLLKLIEDCLIGDCCLGCAYGIFMLA